MTPPQPLTIDELKGLLNGAKMVLYVGIGLLDELTPNAKITRMKVLLVATGQGIDAALKEPDELKYRGACLGTIDILKQARQLVMSSPYPTALKVGRLGWLDACKNMMSTLEAAKYQ